jgi:hypothetical protein
MKVNLFNHWFKYKVPIAKHQDQISDAWFADPSDLRYSSLWRWLDVRFDVGQYYNWKEERNYMCFNDEKHYMMFLLKL